jgi:Domain of unknown function (DUF4402)
MTRLNIILFSLLCLLLTVPVKMSAQTYPPVTATGEIFAEIIPVFAASETSQMNFGRFSPGPQGGEIILTPQSTISLLGSIFRGSGSHNAASFYVTGEIDAAYSITLPSGPVILKHVSDAKTMQVYNWESVPEPGTGTGMLQNGYQNVYIGATLKVGTLYDNPVGIYKGSFTVTFDFN